MASIKVRKVVRHEKQNRSDQMTLAQGLILEILGPLVPAGWNNDEGDECCIFEGTNTLSDPGIVIFDTGDLLVWDTADGDWTPATLDEAVAYLKKHA